jgi:hypothetical protein
LEEQGLAGLRKTVVKRKKEFDMTKKLLQLLLIVLVYTVLFIVTNAVMPFSQVFMELMTADSSSSLPLTLVQNLFICFVIAFIASHSKWRGVKRVLGISAMMFLEIQFMSQIETLLFGSAFPALTAADVWMIMLAQLPAIFIAALLSSLFFGDKDAVPDSPPSPSLTAFLPRIAILGVIFLAVYWVFGFIVIWQSEEARAFYSQGLDTAAQSAGLAALGVSDILFYPLQILRGMMFTGFLLPLFFMLKGKTRSLITMTVCLVYLCTPIMLIAPNPLFPDFLRVLHFIEIGSSMLLFGIITGHVLCQPFAKSRPQMSKA